MAGDAAFPLPMTIPTSLAQLQANPPEGGLLPWPAGQLLPDPTLTAVAPWAAAAGGPVVHQSLMLPGNPPSMALPAGLLLAQQPLLQTGVAAYTPGVSATAAATRLYGTLPTLPEDFPLEEATASDHRAAAAAARAARMQKRRELALKKQRGRPYLVGAAARAAWAVPMQQGTQLPPLPTMQLLSEELLPQGEEPSAKSQKRAVGANPPLQSCCVFNNGLWNENSLPLQLKNVGFTKKSSSSGLTTLLCHSFHALHFEFAQLTALIRLLLQIKNRESAARSRSKRLEYTGTLEHQVEQLKQKNRALREQVIRAAQAPPDPHAGILDGRLLRRTRTTPL